MVASTTLLPQTAGMTLYWHGSSGVRRQVGSQTFAAPVQQSSFHAKGQPATHPALMMHATYESLQAERITIVPCLKVDDPLLQHMALVLQAAVEGEGVAGRLYAESLADALVVHFLRRYVAARQSMQELTGGLSPYKLRRTTAYIKAHLEQELSLATLAAVAQTSPAHFARLFAEAGVLVEDFER